MLRLSVMSWRWFPLSPIQVAFLRVTEIKIEDSLPAIVPASGFRDKRVPIPLGRRRDDEDSLPAIVPTAGFEMRGYQFPRDDGGRTKHLPQLSVEMRTAVTRIRNAADRVDRI